MFVLTTENKSFSFSPRALAAGSGWFVLRWKACSQGLCNTAVPVYNCHLKPAEHSPLKAHKLPSFRGSWLLWRSWCLWQTRPFATECPSVAANDAPGARRSKQHFLNKQRTSSTNFTSLQKQNSDFSSFLLQNSLFFLNGKYHISSEKRKHGV